MTMTATRAMGTRRLGARKTNHFNGTAGALSFLVPWVFIDRRGAAEECTGAPSHPFLLSTDQLALVVTTDSSRSARSSPWEMRELGDVLQPDVSLLSLFSSPRNENGIV